MVTLATELSRGGLCVSLVLSKAEGPYLSVVPSDVQIVGSGLRARPVVPASARRLPATGTAQRRDFRHDACKRDFPLGAAHRKG